MDMMYILAGLLLLFIGGEALLKGSVSLAHSFRVSRILISALIIGFGTSMPELTVSLGAMINNSPDIALGNIIGSNIANILLIIGVSALIRPVSIMGSSAYRDSFAMLLSSVILAMLMWRNALNFTAGILLVTLLVIYILMSIREERANKNNAHTQAELNLDKSYTVFVAFLIAIAGLGCLIGGSSLLISGAMAIAQGYGVSEAAIGLTLVAVGTALPELAIAIIASIKGHGDVALGSVVGSNIFNIAGVLGIASIVHPISISVHMMERDIWVMLAASLFLSIVMIKRMIISRSIGAVMLSSYIIYSVYIYI